ncbi:hypothetical protein OHV05_36255 (plasmid) [Kitasatospora sp. NBC_00070]|uniref:hypothetical protein n=1 Tax=Kitasatospora sp. NBC_00070 TaxID=2975962 RepID=UPI002F914F43
MATPPPPPPSPPPSPTGSSPEDPEKKYSPSREADLYVRIFEKALRESLRTSGGPSGLTHGEIYEATKKAIDSDQVRNLPGDDGYFTSSPVAERITSRRVEIKRAQDNVSKDYSRREKAKISSSNKAKIDIASAKNAVERIETVLRALGKIDGVKSFADPGAMVRLFGGASKLDDFTTDAANALIRSADNLIKNPPALESSSGESSPIEEHRALVSPAESWFESTVRRDLINEIERLQKGLNEILERISRSAKEDFETAVLADRPKEQPKLEDVLSSERGWYRVVATAAVSVGRAAADTWWSKGPADSISVAGLAILNAVNFYYMKNDYQAIEVKKEGGATSLAGRGITVQGFLKSRPGALTEGSARTTKFRADALQDIATLVLAGTAVAYPASLPFLAQWWWPWVDNIVRSAFAEYCDMRIKAAREHDMRVEDAVLEDDQARNKAACDLAVNKSVPKLQMLARRSLYQTAKATMSTSITEEQSKKLASALAPFGVKMLQKLISYVPIDNTLLETRDPASISEMVRAALSQAYAQAKLPESIEDFSNLIGDGAGTAATTADREKKSTSPDKDGPTTTDKEKKSTSPDKDGPTTTAAKIPVWPGWSAESVGGSLIVKPAASGVSFRAELGKGGEELISMVAPAPESDYIGRTQSKDYLPYSGGCYRMRPEPGGTWDAKVEGAWYRPFKSYPHTLLFVPVSLETVGLAFLNEFEVVGDGSQAQELIESDAIRDGFPALQGAPGTGVSSGFMSLRVSGAAVASAASARSPISPSAIPSRPGTDLIEKSSPKGLAGHDFMSPSAEKKAVTNILEGSTVGSWKVKNSTVRDSDFELALELSDGMAEVIGVVFRFTPLGKIKGGLLTGLLTALKPSTPLVPAGSWSKVKPSILKTDELELSGSFYRPFGDSGPMMFVSGSSKDGKTRVKFLEKRLDAVAASTAFPALGGIKMFFDPAKVTIENPAS